MKVSQILANKGFTFSSYPAIIPGFTRWGGLVGLFAELGVRYGVEVGVRRGFYSFRMLSKIPNLTLYLVDPYVNYGDDEAEVSDCKHEDHFKQATIRLKRFPNICFMREKSADAARLFCDNSIDFVYIDGNHSFCYAMEDLIIWSRKVRSGGIVAGHDFCTWPNKVGHHPIRVKEAVKAFTFNCGISEWYLTDEKCPSFFWEKKP